MPDEKTSGDLACLPRRITQEDDLKQYSMELVELLFSLMDSLNRDVITASELSGV